MSGGHWNYMSYKLEEQGRGLAHLFDLLAVIEHELDWGICADTCLDCAKNRVGPAMMAHFDGNHEAAMAIMRDRYQHQCPNCYERDARRKPPSSLTQHSQDGGLDGHD